AGGYAGWLTDQKLFVGGGAYWLANGNRDRELAYGGVVVGWLSHADRPVGFGVKTLVGGGEATLVQPVSLLVYPTPTGRTPTPQPVVPTLRTINKRVRDGFFVAEPEAD